VPDRALSACAQRRRRSYDGGDGAVIIGDVRGGELIGEH